MEYTFRTDQIEILNRLIYDASISLTSIEKLQLVNHCLEFEIERRTFENVIRKKKLFLDYTYLNGKTSTLRFDNVSELSISGLTEQFKTNHFIDKVTIDKNGVLSLATTFGLIVKLNTNSESKIYLNDTKDSDFGKGFIRGNGGFTTEEWTSFLQAENYS